MVPLTLTETALPYTLGILQQRHQQYQFSSSLGPIHALVLHSDHPRSIFDGKFFHGLSACRNIHYSGLFNLDVAYDVPFAKLPSASSATQDFGYTLDVPHLLYNILVKSRITKYRGLLGDIERYVRGLCHLPISELLYLRAWKG